MKPGALIAKKFRLTRQIGEGAMGEVWAATNESTGGEFALKFILKSTKDLRERLMREARAAGGIKHPNVIEIHDVGETIEGDPFLVMPLLAGETLSELLARKRRLEAPEAARIGRDVARALGAAHAKQIIHRDLKPANIFLQQLADVEETVVKVLDFGVSKNLENSDGLSTMTGAAVGSPAYMSPEQAKADRFIDPRADLWSLGVVLFETLTGVRPFQGDANQLIIQITTTEAPRLSRFLRHVDPALDALVARCLERDRDRRISSAIELANEFQRFMSGGQASALQQSSSNMASPFAGGAAPISAAPISAPFNPPSPISSGSPGGGPISAGSPGGGPISAGSPGGGPISAGSPGGGPISAGSPGGGPTPSFTRAPMGSRPDLDPATRAPRLDGLPSMVSDDDDEDDQAATARLGPEVLAAVMGRRPQASGPRFDLTPQPAPLPVSPAPPPAPLPAASPTASQMYEVTAPLSGFGQGAAHAPQFGGAAAASPAPVPPSGNAMGSGQYARMGSSPQIAEPAPQGLGGTIPMMGQQQLRQLRGTVPMGPPVPHDTAPLGVGGPMGGQALSGQVGFGATAGASVESDSALRRMNTTLPLGREGESNPALSSSNARLSPTSSTAGLTRTPTGDPGLGSGAGAMAERKRRLLLAVVISLGVLAVGLGVVVVYNVVSSSSLPKPTAKIEATVPSATALPLTTASAAATATVPASVAAVQASVAEATPPPPATVTQVVSPATTALPSAVVPPPPPPPPPTGRQGGTTSPRGPSATATATTQKAPSPNLPPWLQKR